MIKRFNDRFFNKEYYESNPDDPFKLLMEENRIIKDETLEDVFSFCLDYEIQKKLGLSPFDILTSFDLGTYMRFKDFIINKHKEHMKTLDQTKAQIEKRQQDLIKGTGHATRN